MRSFRKFLFRTDIVAVMFITQAVMDGVILVLTANFLVKNGYVFLSHGSLTLPLLNWSYVSLWAISILVVSLIFGIRVVNRFIYYKQILYAIPIYGLLQMMLFSFWGIKAVSWEGILIVFSATSLAILLLRTLVFLGYKVFSQFTSGQRVIIIGCNGKSEMLHKSLVNNKSRAFHFLGFFDQFDPQSEHCKKHFKGHLENVKSFCLENKVNEIYYTLSSNKLYLDDLSDFADQNFIFLGIVPDLELKERKRLDTAYVGDIDLPIITYRYSPLQKQINYIAKRIFDIFFSGMVILVLGPTLLPIMALIIKLDSPGPVFFIQRRPGRNTRLFDCYKFRTMTVNNDTEKPASKNDKRITRVGAFLRKTSLDELPQFYNVLKGDMSIVGPRPNLITHLDYYAYRSPDYSLRHIITPGITGYAQVNGCRGEGDDHLAMERRVQYDMKYMQNWSFVMDLKIIAKTVIHVVKGDEKAY